jgi:hypothetical protein
MSFPPPSELARWLSERLPRLPDDYQSGREEMARVLTEHLGCSTEEANRVLDDMERAGHLRYAAEARSPGSPGSWVIYLSPAENPEDVALDRAVTEPSGGAARGESGRERE